MQPPPQRSLPTIAEPEAKPRRAQGVRQENPLERTQLNTRRIRAALSAMGVDEREFARIYEETANSVPVMLPASHIEAYGTFEKDRNLRALCDRLNEIDRNPTRVWDAARTKKYLGALMCAKYGL